MPMAQMLCNSQKRKIYGRFKKVHFLSYAQRYVIFYRLINLSHAWNLSCDPVENGENVHKEETPSLQDMLKIH